MLVNNLFDALNAKIPDEGIRINSPQIRVRNIMTIEPLCASSTEALVGDAIENRHFTTTVCFPARIFHLLKHFFLQIIEEFLEMLNSTEKGCKDNNTKMFTSQMTAESLRVTLMSVLDIVEFLHSQGVRYVLTAKLNQDPLEVSIYLCCGRAACS